MQGFKFVSFSASGGSKVYFLYLVQQ